MKIQLKTEEIIKNIPEEYELLDMSNVESLYYIRKLKALIYSLNHGYINVYDINNYKQCYIPEFQIWINENEYEII